MGKEFMLIQNKAKIIIDFLKANDTKIFILLLF